MLIVDDQPIVRAGVARILGPDDGFEVVAECDDGDEVVAAVAAHRPDVVLMDVRMRRLDGVTATRLLAESGDAPPVLILTTFDDDDVLWGALDAGAAGFVLKDARPRTSSPPPGRGRRRGLARPQGRAPGARRLPGERAPPAGRGGAVRPAHRAGARRAAPHGPGRHQRRDRRRLIVSEATVKTHVGAIFAKLGVRDRAAAIVFAYDHGIVEPHPGTEPT